MTIIKSLKLNGFKSFAKHTEILFGTEFNCILGPNGSGKSNIMDALCFVLGKTSAKGLRAEKSANLIYNGGKKGNPAKTAEVTVTFDNSTEKLPLNEKEIIISRTIKSSGTSIYKINNQKRTRQEILDLLGAAKIEPDGHNIILQGDIVRFTQMKPAERKELIEEIAGISVYEEKKQKAMQELEKVQSKLSEAEIILTERGTYLRELKKERDQAVKYKELEKRIRESKATFIHRKIKDKEAKKEEIEKRIKENSDSLEKVDLKIKEVNSLIKSKKEEIETINSKIEVKGKEERIELNKTIEEVKTEIIQNKSRFDVCKNEITKIKQREKQLYLDIEEINKKIEFLKNKKTQLTNKTSKNQINFHKIKDLKKDHSEISKELNKLLNENSIISSQLTRAREDIIKKNEELSKINASKIMIREDLSKGKSIEEILKLNKKGVYGTVSKLGEALPNYSLALEVAAGSRVKSIVVEDDKIGAECIKHLKEKKLGIATFLPLNKIKPSKTDLTIDSLKKIPGVKDLAINLIRYDKKFKTVFSYVFSNTVVVDNISTARKIGVGRVRMVTLDGDLFELSGAMVGGFRRQTNTGFKEKEIDSKASEINEEIEKLKTLINHSERSRIENENKILELREKRSELEKRSIKEEQQIEIENITEIKNINNQITDILEPEKEKIQLIIKQNQRDLQEFQSELEKLEKELKIQSTNLKNKEKLEKDFYDEYKNLFTKRNKLTQEVQEKEQGISKEQERIKSFEQKINSSSIDRAKIVAEIEGLQKEFEPFKDEKIRRNINNEEIIKEISEFEKLIKDLGNINLKALEIYERVEEEYGKILQKNNKLEEEKNDVLNMINEIESQKTETFLETFNVISKDFKGNFSQLTTKGEAILELENKEEPLKEGVDIKVRIVGNKFLDIRSLSGGEKTLAALSFIFAIQEHNPASFYFLDEVDAALDKRNSEKLSKLIKKYSKNAQYIIISHNDNLITEADHIYGISMQEDGKSKVVSLKL